MDFFENLGSKLNKVVLMLPKRSNRFLPSPV